MYDADADDLGLNGRDPSWNETIPLKDWVINLVLRSDSIPNQKSGNPMCNFCVQCNQGGLQCSSFEKVSPIEIS
jgi:hypothetical protein